MKIDRILALIFGTAFLGILTYAGLRDRPIDDPGQFFFLRLVAALSAAATVAAIIPGLIKVKVTTGKGFLIQATGALAVFVVVYAVNPPKLVQRSIRVGREGDRDRTVQMSIVESLYNNSDDAEDKARKVLEKYPDSARAHYNLAVAEVRRISKSPPISNADLDDAADHLSRSLQNDVLNVLLMDEQITDPVGYILNDKDLTLLFERRPGARVAVEAYRSQFQPVTGTKSYGGGGCFPAGTLVQRRDGRRVVIEKIQKGDQILGQDLGGQAVPVVVHDIRIARSPIVILNGSLRVTASQWLLLYSGRWRPAGDLQTGDLLESPQGKPLVVRTIDRDSAEDTVFALTVDPPHTYFAGRVVAHNKLILSDE